MTTKPLRVALIRELTAAVKARAREHQQRQLVTQPSPKAPEVFPRQKGKSWVGRIAEREAVSLECIRVFRVQARLLIADPAILASTLAALARIKQTIRRATSTARHSRP